MKFSQFLETKDIFGFEAQKEKQRDDELSPRPDEPIDTFDLDGLTNMLAKSKIGISEGKVNFMNDVQWGHLPGALKVFVDPQYRVSIKRLCSDLQGNPRWVLKKFWQINKKGFGGYEDMICQRLLDELDKINKQEFETPKNDWNNFDRLVQSLVQKVRRVSPNLFIYRGTKKMDENAYVISFELRGHGLEAPGHLRVEQNQTYVLYDKECGLVRIFNTDIVSPTGGSHEWSMSPADFHEIFFPSQDLDEISECLAVHLKHNYDTWVD